MTEAAMGEPARTELKVIVERAVRPVRAPLDRKKAMREELLAHVEAAFAEESARLGDERAALAETERRFGDPGDVAAELQRSVSAWGRFDDRAERLTQPPPSATPAHRAARLALLIAALNVGMIVFVVLPAALFGMDAWRLRIAAVLLAMIAAGSAILTFAFVLLSNALARALFDPSTRRSLPTAAAVMLTSCIVPAVVLFALYFAVAGDAVAAFGNLRQAALATPAFLLIPVILLIGTRQVERERRYRREWSELRID